MCLFYTCIQSDYFCYSRIIFSSSLNVLFFFRLAILFFCAIISSFSAYRLRFFFFILMRFAFFLLLFDYFHFAEQSVKVKVTYLVDNAQAHNQMFKNENYVCVCVCFFSRSSYFTSCTFALFSYSHYKFCVSDGGRLLFSQPIRYFIILEL